MKTRVRHASRLLAAAFLAATFLSGAAPAAHAADVWFNSEPSTDLTGEIIASLERGIAAAAGKPVEFRVNIFSFTEQSIADKMLELAAAHPNLSISIVTDFSQLSAQGGQARRLEAAGLANIDVRYKKDDPYRWDAAAGRAVYDHGQTDGLDHHKGMATVIDGVPTELVTGSFNWSPTANDSNYENLMRFHREVPAERELIRAFAAEQGAMFRNSAVSLSGPEARAYKTWLLAKYAYDNGAGPNPGAMPVPSTGDGIEPITVCPNPSVQPTLEELVASVNGAVALTGGDLKADPFVFEAGDLVAINHATYDELDAIPGVGPVTAARILAFVDTYGPMETLEDLRRAGIGSATAEKIAAHADLRYSEAFFSSKLLGCDRAGTGFAAMNATNTTRVRNANDDKVSVVPGSLPAPAIDLFRRANPGDTIRIAAYGYSASSPEYLAMKQAVERGAKVEVILNKAYNESVVAALQTLADANPGRVTVKMFRSRTMHQKFAVVGDDVFNGSSNLNTSSTNKHAEDRFVVKNDPAFSGAFQAEFARLWERATWVVGGGTT